MTPMTAALRIRKGASWAYAIGIDSEVVNQTWSVRAQIREDVDCDEVLHTWSTAAGNAALGTAVVDGETLTTLTLTVAPAVSSAWDWTRGVYDVFVTSPDALTAIPVMQGSVTVEPAVTR